ncbi:MAG TPA: hypothetical protein VE566_04000, partial [Nitrososphaeraceae archaeon]|nr:hypothetical protein [Nitrososphaeraceae archaeon]
MSYRKRQSIMSIVLSAIVLTSISAGLVFEFPTEKIVTDGNSIIRTASATAGGGGGGNGEPPEDEAPEDEAPEDEAPEDEAP